MKLSKFVRIDTNILLEYIYDDSNLISEDYSIVFNNNTQVSSFLSSLSKTNNYLSKKSVIENGQVVDKLYTNQLVILDGVQGQYGKLELESYSFIQKRDYGLSIPIRYDKIRVWVPTNYIFKDIKGFHIRAFTMDFSDTKFIDLSNYFFDISDPDRISEMQFANPPLIEYQVPWGKYFEIQFPSTNKVSEQRRNGLTKENTINFNLSNGVGLSKISPIFIDFFFIKSSQNTNGKFFYNLSEKKSVSFPQKPEFEKFGVVIEESNQGDFLLIYPIYNGSIGGFNQFIEESILMGNRYYLDYQIDIFEKNIKVNTHRIIVTDNFIEEIEYRPIFKYTTTTAIIDVSCKLVDSVDGSELERKSTYVFLQDKVSLYSKFLSKIDLSKSKKMEVYKIKGISTPNLDINNPNTIHNNLNIVKDSFSLYSNSFNIVKDSSNSNYLGIKWLSNRQLSIMLYPFSNLLKFSIIYTLINDQYSELDMSIYSIIKLSFISDNKSIDFDIYRDSDQNDLNNGVVVFKINEDKYLDIKKIYNSGFNTFYINGILNNSNEIIYTGYYEIWDSSNNIGLINNKFEQGSMLLLTKNYKKISEVESKKISDIKNIISSNLNIQTSVITNNMDNAISQKMNINPNSSLSEVLLNIESQIFNKWLPYWISNESVISYKYMIQSYNYKMKYEVPKNIRDFAITLKNYGIISDISVNKNTGQLSAITQLEIDKILGYFKIYNFSPLDNDIIQFISNDMSDINNYLVSKLSIPQARIKQGCNTPPNKEVKDMIESLIFKKEQNN